MQRCRTAVFGCLGLVLFGCSNGTADPNADDARPQQIDSVLADGGLGRTVASGPVPPGQAFWSGTPVPRLKNRESYVINSVEAVSTEGAQARVRVGVTQGLAGATQEPPDAYTFEEFPHRVREFDWVAAAIELDSDESAAVVGLRVDATLEDGQTIQMVLPVAVAACSDLISDAAQQCADISNALNAQMGGEPAAWGVFER